MRGRREEFDHCPLITVFKEHPVKRICVDMDEVMADTLAEHIRC